MKYALVVEFECDPSYAKHVKDDLSEWAEHFQTVNAPSATGAGVASMKVKGPMALENKKGVQVLPVYTDGACVKNPGGPGGWGFLIVHPTGNEEHYGGEPETTNNRMEMMAVIKALEHIEPGPNIVVYTDSKYVLNGITVWVHRWKSNGWRTADGNPVKNAELWNRLDKACARHGGKVQFRWVKGHAGHTHNEMADRLANRGMQPFLYGGGQVCE